jgi:hypothetical protein
MVYSDPVYSLDYVSYSSCSASSLSKKEVRTMKKEFPPLLVYSHYDDGTVTVHCPYLNKPPEIVEGPGVKPDEEPVAAPPPEIAKPTYKQRTCKRCDYTWTPRKKQKPVQCPKCKSPYWNKEKKKV